MDDEYCHGNWHKDTHRNFMTGVCMGGACLVVICCKKIHVPRRRQLSGLSYSQLRHHAYFVGYSIFIKSYRANIIGLMDLSSLYWDFSNKYVQVLT